MGHRGLVDIELMILNHTFKRSNSDHLNEEEHNQRIFHAASWMFHSMNGMRHHSLTIPMYIYHPILAERTFYHDTISNTKSAISNYKLWMHLLSTIVYMWILQTLNAAILAIKKSIKEKMFLKALPSWNLI